MSTEKSKGGVLPISGSATRKNQPSQAQAKTAQRAPAPRLRLVIRRLPPGLTESEFWSSLGEEWQLGKGRIDWAAYKDGKVSRDPSKPSRPARAYLKVKDQTMLDDLSLKVKQVTFQDGRNTSKDSCLLGPPSLEFAPYNKMPGNRIRHDGRQGTIDQDQEFIDFLQSLTEPITKTNANDIDTAEAASEKVTTTPLVQYLKEKKANKAKEAAEKKSKAKQEGKETKASKAEAKSAVVVKGPTSAAEKARVAKATQDAVKAINKSVVAMQTKPPAAAKTETKPTSKEAAPPPAPPAKPVRERGNASAAARMLQRDLGLAPKSPRASRVTPASPTTSKAEPASSEKPPAPPTQPKAISASPNTPNAPPTGPRNSRPPTIASAPPVNNPPAAPTTATSTAPTKSAPSQPTRSSKPVPNPSPNAKSAFLKHANPSQGVTEDLLRTTFSTYGTVLRCEIDKKKGLGYVDFDDTESLRKAMQASPVKVGSGQVVVLENRNPGKGKGVVAAKTAVSAGGATSTAATTATETPAPAASFPVATTATPAPPPTSVPTAPAAEAPKSPTAPDAALATPAPATAPTAPRASTRGGPRGGRGAAANSRGNFPVARGTGRGAFRSRGTFGPHSRGGRGGSAGSAVKSTVDGGGTAATSDAAAGGAMSGGGEGDAK